MMNLFRKKGNINGTVSVESMPETKMFSISITFFPVSKETSKPPYNGEPPANKYTEKNTVYIKEAQDSMESPFKFSVERKTGYYYIAVGVIAYMEKEGEMYAQVERFFPLSKPVTVKHDNETFVELNSTWPDVPFEELGSYGKFSPSNK